MMTIALRRAWIAFVMIDALLLITVHSAVAAPAVAPTLPLHLPAVLLGGLGLLVTSLTGQRVRR